MESSILPFSMFMFVRNLRNKFIEYADSWKNEKVTILFLRVVAEFLKLHHSPAEAGRGNKITIYNIPVKFSDGSKQYRKMIWNSLFELYNNENYKLKIETIIKEYGQHYSNEVDEDIVKYDFQYILSFFNEKFSSSLISHCIIAKIVSDRVKRNGIDATTQFLKYLSSPDYLIYCILKGERHLEEFSWEKEKELKESDIKKLSGKCDQDNILKILKICSALEKYDYSNSWDIQDGLQYLFSCLSTNKELFLFAVNSYLAYNTPLDLFPDNIILKLFEIFGDKRTYEVINNIEFDKKNAWKFSFYKNLPREFISESYVQSFYAFLSEEEGNITSSPYRNVEFLKNYIVYDHEVFIKASRIIVKKYDYSPFIFSVYFGLMFNSHVTKPDILIERYKEDWNLLKDIYFKMISYDKHEDYDGAFLIKFAKYAPSFIDEYIEFTVSQERKSWIHGDEERLSAIWDCENCIELADKIIKKYCAYEEIGMWQISLYIENILKIRDKTDAQTSCQDDWISHYINCNYRNVYLMKLLFSSIKEISPERRKIHILHLIRLNPDPELFNDLSLESSSWSWVGSIIPYIEERITFLKSLLPELHGLAYLKHKQRIERDIMMWQRQIEQEQIDEVLEGK